MEPTRHNAKDNFLIEKIITTEKMELLMKRIDDGKDGKTDIILIVEDHNALRASLRNLLSAYFPHSIILEAKNGEEAISLAFAHHPDVVLMDISMPEINGIESTRCIKKELPMTQVVVLTIHENREYRADAAAAGASIFIPKRKMGTDLVPVLSDLLVGPTNSS
jgi:DNA-binding NarL/FixJ family response regulator